MRSERNVNGFAKSQEAAQAESVSFSDGSGRGRQQVKKSEGFEPRGLAGYRVFQDRDGSWWFMRPAEVPHSFDWDEATQAHTKPVFNDWALGGAWSASGCVAAAHRHDAWAKAQTAVCS